MARESNGCPIRTVAWLVTMLVASGWCVGASNAQPCESATTDLAAGRTEEAAARFAALMQERPDSDCAVEGRVRALIVLDRWEEALAEARRAHDARPEGVGPRAALGEALYRAGRLGQAEELLDGIVSEDAAGGPALSLLGLLRAASGREAEAARLMERAVARAPDDPLVLIRAAEATPERAATISLLERYLDRSSGEDPDRVEGARGTLRTLRALGARDVWVVERAPERVELPLQLLSAGRGRVSGAVLRVELGDPPRPVRLLLDTGSSGLFLLERVARKRGFEPISEETAFGGGGGQRHAGARGLLPRVGLGDLAFRDALATTTDREFDPTGRYHGVLGIGVFAGYRVVIDLRRGKLLLERDGELDAATRYWNVSGQMLVEASATGGQPGMFLFDTGASVSVLDAGYAERVPGTQLRESASMRGYGGMLEGARFVSGTEVVFEGRESGAGTLRAVDLALRSRLGGVELAGYVGLDVLGGTRWIIDVTGRKLRVDE